jgi:hypothetical protein
LPKCSSPDSGASPKCCSLNEKAQNLRELFSPGVGICFFFLTQCGNLLTWCGRPFSLLIHCGWRDITYGTDV